MNTNEKRKNIRYEISEYIKENFKDIYIEIKADNVYRAEVSDISMNGLGFFIEDNKDYNFDELNKMTNYFIKIIFSDKEILTEVTKAWGVIVSKGTKKVLQGGLIFSVISSEDRLYLADYINSLRS